MNTRLDPTKAVHTWSLFRTMGRFVAPGSVPSGHLRPNENRDGLSVLELPGQLAAHGYTSAQLCHFYLPTTAPSFLQELRGAFDAAGVDIECFLVDDGDVIDPDRGEENLDWLSRWIDVAQALACPRVRVPAGDQPPTPQLLELSAQRLRSLAARHPGIRLLTENWLALLPDASTTVQLIDRLENEVGLLIDTGNWDGPDKYDQIRSVAGAAEASQVKARELPDGTIDSEDFVRSLEALQAADYTGRVSLVYSGASDNEWGQLEQLYEMSPQA